VDFNVFSVPFQILYLNFYLTFFMTFHDHLCPFICVFEYLGKHNTNISLIIIIYHHFNDDDTPAFTWSFTLVTRPLALQSTVSGTGPPAAAPWKAEGALWRSGGIRSVASVRSLSSRV